MSLTILGVGIAIVGVVVWARCSLSRYLRYWLVRDLYEQRASTDRIVEAIERPVREVNHRDAAIPLGAAWSSPFVRWQGSLADINSIDLAAQVARDALASCRASIAARLDSLVLGITVPQKESFFGGPTLAAKIGVPDITGPMISQACATSAKCVQIGAAPPMPARSSRSSPPTARATARCSRIPRARVRVARPTIEHWILDNFKKDPWAGQAMVDTAEAVAAEAGIERGELDELTLLRYEQYEAALADDRAFQRRLDGPGHGAAPRPRSARHRRGRGHLRDDGGGPARSSRPSRRMVSSPSAPRRIPPTAPRAWSSPRPRSPVS